MPPDQPNDDGQEQLNQDGQTPFQPADPGSSSTADPAAPPADLPDDHPATDTNIDPTQLYQEGVAGAAEVKDTSSQSAVTDYQPNEIDDQAL